MVKPTHPPHPSPPDPSQAPVALSVARKHLRLVPDNEGESNESHPDDDLILAYLIAACEHCEQFTGLAVLRRSYRLSYSGFPTSGEEPMELGIYPVESLDSVEGYVGGVLTDLGLSNFELDSYANPAQVRIQSGTSWPGVDDEHNAIHVTVTAGYYDPDAPLSSGFALPYTLRAAILLTMAHLYENRAENVERAVTALPLGVEALLRPLRTRLGMA